MTRKATGRYKDEPELRRKLKHYYKYAGTDEDIFPHLSPWRKDECAELSIKEFRTRGDKKPKNN